MKVRQDYDGMKNQESRFQNEWDQCQQSSEPSLPLSTIDALCIFEKKRAKNVQLSAIVSSGFSSKNREILHKAVLTPQEYEDYFSWKKIRKKMGEKIKKPVGGVCAS